jgi:hypothetical protein
VNCQRYSDYGGRGISVTKTWDIFDNFCQWAMLNGYQEGLSLDRINNDADYSPSNCKWSTPTEQANNRRSNKFIVINGVTKTIQQWAEHSGLPSSTLKNRIKRGWQDEDLLQSSKDMGPKTLEINGVSKSLSEWAESIGIQKQTLIQRYHRGARGMELLTPKGRRKS